MPCCGGKNRIYDDDINPKSAKVIINAIILASVAILMAAGIIAYYVQR